MVAVKKYILKLGTAKQNVFGYAKYTIMALLCKSLHG